MHIRIGLTISYTWCIGAVILKQLKKTAKSLIANNAMDLKQRLSNMRKLYYKPDCFPGDWEDIELPPFKYSSS